MDGYLAGWGIGEIIDSMTQNATISIEQFGGGVRRCETAGWSVVACPKTDCRPAQAFQGAGVDGLSGALKAAHHWLKH